MTATCSDTHGCDITMGESTAVSGAQVVIVNIGSNSVNFADSSGVSELTGAVTLGQWDVLQLVYAGDRWVMSSPVTNN